MTVMMKKIEKASLTVGAGVGAGAGAGVGAGVVTGGGARDSNKLIISGMEIFGGNIWCENIWWKYIVWEYLQSTKLDLSFSI